MTKLKRTTWRSLFTISGASHQDHQHRAAGANGRQIKRKTTSAPGCTFINFVLWLHAERLGDASGFRPQKTADASFSDDNGFNLDPEQLALGLRAESNGTSMNHPAETIESVIWLQRIRARMRIDRAISKHSNADSSRVLRAFTNTTICEYGCRHSSSMAERIVAPRRRERASL